MRLEPIDRPPTLLVRLVFFVLRRAFGRVPTPYRVLFTRHPRVMLAHAMHVHAMDARHGLDDQLRYLLQLHVARLNGCTFCADMMESVARRRGVKREVVAALNDWRTSSAIGPRERAALAWAEETVRTRHPSDATFAALRANFDEAEIVRITWLVATETYLNMMTVPLEIGSDGFCTLPTATPPGTTTALTGT